MAKKSKTKSEKQGRKSIYGPGTTPNKTDARKLAKQYTSQDGRSSMAGMAEFAVNEGVSADGLVLMVGYGLGKEIDADKAATLRRAAFRKINGGATVKQERKPAKPAKPAKRGKRKKAA